MTDSITPELSITMASYNACSCTRAAIQSIIEQTENLSYEIIVIDNASDDGTADMLKRDFPQVRLLCNRRNLGFAVAQNMGILAARGNFILVLNNDTQFVGNAARTMIDSMREAGPDLGFLGPQITHANGTVAHTMRRTAAYSKTMVALSIINRYFDYARIIPLGFIRKYLGGIFGRVHDAFQPLTHPQQVEWVDGMCVMMRRTALESVGLFDEQFFFGSEIGDLLLRGRTAGWHVMYEPRAHVIHKGGLSRRAYSLPGFYSQMGWMRYHAKHFGNYVGMMRRTNLIVLALAIRKERLMRLLGSREVERSARIVAMNRLRNAIRNFDVDQVKDDVRIPQLTITTNSNLKFEPERQPVERIG